MGGRSHRKYLERNLNIRARMTDGGRRANP
jgi:hypothetical protein